MATTGANPHATAELMKNAVSELIDGEAKDAEIVNCWTVDAGKWCQCEACKAMSPVLDAIASRDSDNRKLWTGISDATWIGAMAFRAVDSTLTPGLVHDDWRTSGRMVVTDLEAFGFMSGVVATVQPIVGRTRPVSEGCDDPSVNSGFCGPEENRSFISGHAATAATGAALTCTHHLNMPLLGPRWAGATLCGVTSGLAVVNGIGRIANETHYPTDIVLGWAVGVVAGWIVPQSLRYGWRGEPRAVADEDRPRIRWSVVPGDAGVGLRARF